MAKSRDAKPGSRMRGILSLFYSFMYPLLSESIPILIDLVGEPLLISTQCRAEFLGLWRGAQSPTSNLNQ